MQRNASRALRRAETEARRADGSATFPALHATDAQGAPLAPAPGAVPSFHGLRHTAASEAIRDGESAEEVSWQLGHKDSTVTRKVYVHEIKSAERSGERREKFEARLGSILEAGDGSESQTSDPPEAQIVPTR